MTRKRTIRQGALFVASLFAVVVLFAGCGGGGGGGSVSTPRYGNLSVTVDVPENPAEGAGRVAASCSSSYTYSATVSVQEYSSSASTASTSKASTSASLSCNTSTGKVTGTFKLTQIPVGSNYIVKAVKYYSYSESQPRSAGSSVVGAYSGAIVDTISDGVTSSVTINATSTVVALATLRYALTRSTPVAMSNTTTISSSAKSAISTAVASLWASNNTSYLSYMVYASADPFDTSLWSANTTLTGLLDAIITAADFAPKVSKFYIDSTEISPSASSATGVDTESPVFKIVFTEGMDTSVDLNNSSTLTSVAPVINLASSGGGTLAINSSNARNYGSFAWATTTVAGDTLTYTLNSTLTLKSNSLKYLKASDTYTISSWTLTGSSYLKSAGGVPFSTSGISTTGSFTTVDTTAPTVYRFSINGTEISTTSTSATGVPYDSAEFKIVFSESIDTALMDTESELASSSMLISLERSDTGGDLIVGDSPKYGLEFMDYGELDWQTTNFASDTIAFTLYSNQTLTANGLKTLQSGKTYTIKSWTAPTTIEDTAGNALSTTGVAATGSFTTQ